MAQPADPGRDPGGRPADPLVALEGFVETVIRAYCDLAQAAGLTPAQMALAFVRQRPFVTSTIIGATTLPQLQENLSAFDVTLSADVLKGIEAIHRLRPNPCP